MHIIMGGTGHVGSETARALLSRGEAVAIVTRDPDKAAAWKAKGAEIVEADVDDVPSLRTAFRRGRTAFLLNPPADPSTDTDEREKRTIANILAALDGSGLEKVVAASTGGAQPSDRIGDLGTLWRLEEGLRCQAIPAAINRAAYYMSNWDGPIGVARETGALPTMYPANLSFPMIAPQDLGQAAAERLVSGIEDTGVRYVAGPKSYSSADVAKVLSAILGEAIGADVTPPGRWKEAWLALGFSEPAAESYAGMVETTLKGGFDIPGDAWRGSTTLETYFREEVSRVVEVDRAAVRKDDPLPDDQRAFLTEGHETVVSGFDG